MSTPDRPAKKDLKSIAADVVRLSWLLTRERERLPFEYMKDDRLRRAYLAYFVPSNIPKIHIPLKELASHPAGLIPKDRLRVIDLGSGPGTALLGIMDFFSTREERPFLELTAVDSVPENLDDAMSLFMSWKKRTGLDSTLRTLKSPVEHAHLRLSKERFDIAVLSNVLNELFCGHEDRISKRRDLILRIMDRLLNLGGSCIIIEPALRDTSREMLDAVCGLLGMGIHIYSPCHPAGLCATLSNPRDWQHEEAAWDPPGLVKEIDRFTGLVKDALKFSYVVLRKDNLSILDVFGENAYRVVSEPLASKGKLEYYLCGQDGRRRVVRLDKDRTDANSRFNVLRRGDFVLFKGHIDEGSRLKITKGTEVTVKRV